MSEEVRQRGTERGGERERERERERVGKLELPASVHVEMG